MHSSKPLNDGGELSRSLFDLKSRNMDPKSLLVLPDDVLLETLSYMPLKSRVRHSRTCSRMSNVVDESLNGVKDLNRLKPSNDQIDSQLKTLSKMKNLRTVCESLPKHERWLQVLIQNCQKIEELRGWKIHLVENYITGLREKGVPIALKIIAPSYDYGGDDEQQSESLVRVFACVDAKLHIDNDEKMFELVTSQADLLLKVKEMDAWFLEKFTWRILAPDNKLKKTLELHNLEKISHVLFEKPLHLKLLLNSLPHLKHVEMYIVRDAHTIFGHFIHM